MAKKKEKKVVIEENIKEDIENNIEEDIEENKIVNSVVKENKIEKQSPEKWARIYKLDTDLFKWWTDKQVLMTKKEFEEIKKQIYGE